MIKLAIFASGNGGNAEAIIKGCQSGEIKAEVKILISDNPEAYVLKRSEKYNILTYVFEPKKYHSKQAYEEEIIEKLKPLKIDFICLAGYMRIVSSKLINEYPHRIINIHPSLLPAFKGSHGIADAYSYGVKIMGATIHLIDEKIDEGKILDQDCFYVTEEDNLASVEEKMHYIEHKLYLKVLKKLAEGEK